jgi:hypothetical protein
MTKALSILLVTVAAAAAQTPAPSAWFGVNLPPGLGDPHRPVVDLHAAGGAERGRCDSAGRASHYRFLEREPRGGRSRSGGA